MLTTRSISKTWTAKKKNHHHSLSVTVNTPKTIHSCKTRKKKFQRTKCLVVIKHTKVHNSERFLRNFVLKFNCWHVCVCFKLGHFTNHGWWNAMYRSMYNRVESTCTFIDVQWFSFADTTFLRFYKPFSTLQTCKTKYKIK